ncbi:hypothetical protein ACED29_20665 [Shewanella sp. 5S214]|uniref:hypothetical protein n=1 Tax=Shewanella sp. 5S214 TaxID=3229999 RepID=UPI00352D3CAA
MKKILLITLMFISPVMAVQIESDAQFSSNVDRNDTELINAITDMVIGSGYRCDSVSAITRSSWDGNFTLLCNGYNYKYQIEDKGGNWTVTLD